MVELDFWQTLVIVVSPIIIGAISTHVLSRSWQKYQQKITMKQELIDLYHQSIFSLRAKQLFLINEIADSVAGNLETTDELLERSSVRSQIHFPENPEKELQEKFMPQYIGLKDMTSNASEQRNLFKIRLKLYTDDPTILDDLTELTRNNIRHRISIKNLINSKNSNEFRDNLNKINELAEKFTKQAVLFSKKLINTKIKDIVV